MDPFRDLLFSKAFQVVPGPLYNQVSQGLRESGNLLFYEVVLREETPWKHLRDQVYPALARYLRHKSLSPELPEGVVVSLFFQDRFYLLEGSEFMKFYGEIEGLDSEAFHFRVRDWTSNTEEGEDTEDQDGFRPDLPAIRK
jgi:hypothetical protein